jgi:hypothetical protein
MRCSGKPALLDATIARRVAREHEAREGGLFRVYLCIECQWWHVERKEVTGGLRQGTAPDLAQRGAAPEATPEKKMVGEQG